MARLGIFGRYLIPAAFALTLAALPAQAQTWVAPANPNIPVLGPQIASGAIIWSHGRSIDSEDSQAPTPPYMAALRDRGWDTYRFNRMRRGDTLNDSADALVDVVKDLKAKGYRQVALAGQSFGGFLSLMAADATDQVDAVVATAPAAYGSFNDFYESWRNNATRLYPLLERVRHAKVMLFYFHGDDFDPGGRGEHSRDILTARHLPFVVVDQPARLTTHWAATTPLFVQLYADCILGFLDAKALGSGARCDGDTLVAGGEERPAAPIASVQGTATRR